MKKILAAVDFSESSTNAAKYALQLAQGVKGASLTLYYTYEIITPGSDGTPLLVDAESRKAVALRALNNLTAELGPSGSVAVDVVAEAGSFTSALEKYVAHLGIDLVVMGITGSTRLEQIIIGSNTLNLINKDICPVLIVPSGVTYKPIKTAALTTDLKDVETTTPVKSLASFLTTFHPELFVAHVAMEAGTISDSDMAEKEKLETILQQYSPRYFYIHEEDFIVAIDKFVEEHQPDIIITVPREHSFLSRLFKESYTKKLAYNSRLPILAIHSKQG
jgi:nucleotide-binding universal stress UspA family protein